MFAEERFFIQFEKVRTASLHWTEIIVKTIKHNAKVGVNRANYPGGYASDSHAV